MNDELTLLKERADTLGIKYSPNIGIAALRQKIQEKLDAPEPEVGETHPDADARVGHVLPLNGKRREMAVRKQQQAEQLKLVRLRISNLNPIKKDLRGEIITIGNKYIGTVRKFVPYGEATDNGFHVPYVIYNELKSRKFISIKRKKVAGKEVTEQHLVPEFALEILEPLTQAELNQLARQQAAAAGL